MTNATHIISAQALHALPQDTLLIIDTRHSLADFSYGRNAYQTGHIPNAHFLDIENDLSGQKTGQNGRHPLPDFDQLTQKLRTLGMNDDTQVVVYDDAGGMMAARLWWLIRALGHEQVAVLDGGIQAWQREGFPLTTELPPVPAEGHFQRKPSLMRVLTVNQIAQNIDNPEVILVDARSPERYRGETEPIDPIAGHIPSALNYFCANNLQTDQTFKPAAELRQQWTDLLGETAINDIQSIVHYCGSGITASHNLLSMHIAGLDVSQNGAGLYAGSWSEWIADTQRPREPN